MFTPDDQAAIVALITPLLEQTIGNAVAVAGAATPVPVWRPGTCVALNGSVASVVTDEPGATPFDASIIGDPPAAGARVMIVFAPPSAVFVFAMNGLTGPTIYAPVVTGWALGNGTVSGKWSQRPDGLVSCWGKIVVGSSTTFGARLVTSIPVPASAARWFFGGNLKDNSGSIFTPCQWRIGDGGSSTLEPFALASATAMNNAGLTSTVPWTWAVNDEVEWFVEYYP